MIRKRDLFKKIEQLEQENKKQSKENIALSQQLENKKQYNPSIECRGCACLIEQDVTLRMPYGACDVTQSGFFCQRNCDCDKFRQARTEPKRPSE